MLLERRLSLLAEVGRLGRSLDVSGDISSSCDTAEHFYLSSVLPSWNRFQALETSDANALSDAFPFRIFFANTKLEGDVQVGLLHLLLFFSSSSHYCCVPSDMPRHRQQMLWSPSEDVSAASRMSSHGGTQDLTRQDTGEYQYHHPHHGLDDDAWRVVPVEQARSHCGDDLHARSVEVQRPR